MDEIKFEILTQPLLRSLKDNGNTVISAKRYEKAIRLVASDPACMVHDQNVSSIDKREIYKTILLEEIERLAGFKVTVTLMPPTSRISFLDYEEKPTYIVEKIKEPIK